MEFVALVSGGKDSIYNITQAIRHGHKLVALANLYPASTEAVKQDGGDALTSDALPVELDSYMLQTVGHTAIESMAICLDKPLYRQQTQGKHVQSSLSYETPVCADGAAVKDEVEDVYELLSRVKAAHPSITAVACGAILSNYQRTRVENVAQRLGLVVFSFLWQREQVGLLQDMIDSGIEAVLIKVASYGLTARMLGQSIRDLYPKFMKAKDECGLNVCGEGGEYESLVLDCPLFSSRRLRISAARHITVDSNPYAPVAHLDIECELVHKERGEGSEAGSRGGCAPEEGSSALATTDMHSPHYKQTKTAIKTVQNGPVILPMDLKHVGKRVAAAGEGIDGVWRHLAPYLAACIRRVGATFLSDGINIHSFAHDISLNSGICGAESDTATSLLDQLIDAVDAEVPGTRAGILSSDASLQVQAQTHILLSALSCAAQAVGSQLTDCLFAHVYLRDMALFAPMNDAFCQYFAEGPPSRSCVAVNLSGTATDLPQPLVAMDVFGLVGSHARMSQADSAYRTCLHVRSLSDWAPLCIGPYCQANVFRDAVCFVAGQIPLVPETMQLVKSDVMPSVKQAMLNSARILSSLNSCVPCAISCSVFLNSSLADELGLDSADLPRLVRAEVEDWLMGARGSATLHREPSHSSDSEEEGPTPAALRMEAEAPEYNLVDLGKASTCPPGYARRGAKPRQVLPVHLISVKDLPRHALLEVEIVAAKDRCAVELSMAPSVGGAAQVHAVGSVCSSSWSHVVGEEGEDAIARTLTALASVPTDCASHARLYTYAHECSGSFASQLLQRAQQALDNPSRITLSCIPCERPCDFDISTSAGYNVTIHVMSFSRQEDV